MNSRKKNKVTPDHPGHFKANESHTRMLEEVGRLSAERSIRENKVLGLPITYLEDGKIIREQANGSKEIIGQL